MGQVWIKCITIVRAANNHGQTVTYYPGDWCQVGMYQARQLVAAGSAEIQNPVTRAQTFELADCGVVAYGGSRLGATTSIGTALPELKVETDERGPRLAFNRTLIYDPSVKLTTLLIPIGFYRLTTGWRMASPVIPRKGDGTEYLTAEMIGTPADQAATKAIIRDLRCPVYDPRVVFALQCPECEDVIAQWNEERVLPGNDSRLAFLRAWYTHKPKMCGLPASWYAR